MILYILMNRYQWIYQLGRGVHHNADFIFLSFSGFFLYNSGNFLYNSGNIFSTTGSLIDLTSNLLNLSFGTLSLIYGIGYCKNKDEVVNKKSSQNLKNVVIEDKKGLEILIEKTGKKEKKEWGTLLKAYNDNERAVIYQILDIEKSRKLRLITKERGYSLELDKKNSEIMGFNGYHHYHPRILFKSLSSINFSINYNDRVVPDNWINLLSFNMPYGPEIIAFNRDSIFMPIDSSKKEFIRASPKNIMSYLN